MYKYKTLLTSLLYCLLLCLSVAACREEEAPIASELNRISTPYLQTKQYKGIYILNEGTMGRNIASLDYFDYTTGIYHRNIFAERNPYIARELGDVGNDLKLYRGELWAVINSSNLIEIMEAESAQHRTQLSIANPRYLAFDDGFAYVSSYAGPIALDPNSRPGKIVKIDISTKQIVAECLVGYQPEEIAIVGRRLYVANSGGYRKPNYDNRMSIINLDNFQLIKHIPIGVNLNRLKADKYGRLWITARGNYKDIPQKLYIYDTTKEQIISAGEAINIPCNDLILTEDKAYLYGAEDGGEQRPTTHFVSIDLKSLKISDPQLLKGAETNIYRPYGIGFNPEQRELLIADAGNYINPGRVLCFDLEGRKRWSVQAGIIPSVFLLTPFALKKPQESSETDLYPEGQRPYAHSVIEYRPAPGQFVNKMPAYQTGDTEERMRQKAEDALARPRKSDKGSLVTLGAWGGYIVLKFDHQVENKAGLCDLQVLGNTFEGGSEPGIIYVAQDLNGNDYPDPSEWRRIRGSAERIATEAFFPKLQAQGKDLELYLDYTLSYSRPQQELQASEEQRLPYISWQDNKGKKGYIYKNGFHHQSYYPAWLRREAMLHFEGVRLPCNILRPIDTNNGQGIYFAYAFSYGYADNAPNDSNGSAIDIDWAVDAEGNPAKLTGIDFVKIQTGIQSDNGPLGESSTELAGIADLHLLGKSIKSPI